MCVVRANQNAERPVSTRPLSGISVGRITSNVEIRSEATSSRRSSSSAYSSRTFPLPRCTATSGMDVLLAQGAEPLEDDVDVPRVRAEVEDGVEIDTGGDFVVGTRERREVDARVPGTDRVSLPAPGGVDTPETRVDEREPQPLAEVEAMARLQLLAHPLGAHDEALHQPREPVEHVVDGEKGVGEGDPRRRGMRD